MTTIETLPMPATPVLARVRRFAGAAAVHVVAWLRAYKSRRDLQLLSGFDDRMLKDIGLTRGDLRDAVAEPLWRDPTTVLVMRVSERRRAIRAAHSGSSGLFKPAFDPQLVEAPPLAPDIDTWSSRLFPARSRYY